MSNRRKVKGNNGERELAKMLSDYFDSSFIRVPNSGAYVGGTNAFRKDVLTEKQVNVFKADIMTPDHLPHLVIESKFYGDFQYHRLVKGEDVLDLDKWIADLEHDCDEGDVGFLCIKINHKGWMVIFSADWKSNFDVPNYTMYKGYVITSLTDFFEKNTVSVSNLCS